MKTYFAGREEMREILGVTGIEFDYLVRALNLPHVMMIGAVKYIVPLVMEKLDTYFKGGDRYQFPPRECNIFDHAAGEISPMFKTLGPVDEKVTEWIAKCFADSTIGLDSGDDKRTEACAEVAARISGIIRRSDFFEFMSDRVKSFLGHSKHNDAGKKNGVANTLLGELCIMMRALDRLFLKEREQGQGGFSPAERERIFGRIFEGLEIPIEALLRKVTRVVAEREKSVAALMGLVKKYPICLMVYQEMIDLQAIYDEMNAGYSFYKD